MVRTFSVSILFVLSIFGASVATADQGRLYFLSADAIDLDKDVAAPPKAGSPEDQRDLDELLRLQAARTKAECARAVVGATGPHIFLFVDAGVLSAKEATALSGFQRKIYNDVGYFTMVGKTKWARERPYIRFPNKIEPCVPRESSLAYPSGHGAIGWATALALAEIFPDRREALLATGAQIGDDRVLAGVHHPSDVEAGRRIGALAFAAMMKNPEFKKALKTPSL